MKILTQDPGDPVAQEAPREAVKERSGNKDFTDNPVVPMLLRFQPAALEDWVTSAFPSGETENGLQKSRMFMLEGVAGNAEPKDG